MNERELILEGYTLKEVPIGGLSFSVEAVETFYPPTKVHMVMAKKRIRIAMIKEDDTYSSMGVVAGVCRKRDGQVVRIYSKDLPSTAHSGYGRRGGLSHQQELYRAILQAERNGHIAIPRMQRQFIESAVATIREAADRSSTRSRHYHYGIGDTSSSMPFWSPTIRGQEVVSAPASEFPPSVPRKAVLKPVEHRTITAISGINKVVNETVLHIADHGPNTWFRYQEVVDELPERTRNTFGRHTRGVFFQELG